MDIEQLIGLEVRDAESFLLKKGITDFKFVYYVDRKQKEFDKELVAAACIRDGCLVLTVCRYKFGVQ